MYVDSRFAEAAKLVDVCWLEFRGKMHYPIQDAIVEVGQTRSTRRVYLQQAAGDDEMDETEAQRRGGARASRRRRTPPDAHVQLPRERADGCMELEMGEFFSGASGADEDGDVSVTLMAAIGRVASFCTALKLGRMEKVLCETHLASRPRQKINKETIFAKALPLDDDVGEGAGSLCVYSSLPTLLILNTTNKYQIFLGALLQRH
jgi:hypothetical protein